MKRMLGIVTSLGLMLVGFSIAGTVLHFWGPHYADALTWAATVGIVLGLAEVELIGKISSPESQYLRLDGMIFPFFSVGVAATIILFQ